MNRPVSPLSPPSRARHREDGATATEYIFLLVFIAIAIIAGATLLGNALNTGFGDAAGDIPPASPAPAP